MKTIKILVLVVSMLFAFNQAIAETPDYGDTIIQASIGDASTLLPPLPTDGASWDICGLVYNGLLKNEKNLNGKIGVLAKSWEISDDNLVITFHLRDDVKWHDGVEFTAEDVLFTYQVIIDPKTPTVYSGDYEMVEKVEVLDKYTIKVTYKEVFATALDSWGMSIIPKHLLEGVEDITQSPLNRHPIGTGPYKFVEWVPGTRIVLEANDGYFEGRPYIDRFVYRIIPDPATMFMELQAGTIDEMGLTAIQYSRQTNSEKFLSQFDKYNYPSISSYTYLGFNLEDPRFKDKRVRQAFAYATSKEDLVRGVLLNLGREATGPYVPDERLWYYNGNVKEYNLRGEVANIVKELEKLRKIPLEQVDLSYLEERYGISFDYLYELNPIKKSKLIKVLIQILSAFSGTSIPEMEYGPQHSIKELFLETLKNINDMNDEKIEKSAKEIIREVERQKARYLLKEAGWTDTNGDGVLDKEGQDFEFTVMTNQGNQARELTALILQQELAKIGVKEKIKIVEWSSFISEFIDKGNFEAIILGWGLGTDPDQYDIWHSSKIPVKDKEGNIVKKGLNFVFFKNGEVDELLVKGRKTLNQAERKKYYDRIQEIFAEEQPYVFLYVGDATLAVHKRFKGIEPALTGISHNFIKWYVPESEQKYITP